MSLLLIAHVLLYIISSVCGVCMHISMKAKLVHRKQCYVKRAKMINIGKMPMPL
jgi:hypothetical protein